MAREIPHETTSRHRSSKKSRPMNATEIAATLSVRAADVCRRYLPRGRKQGRYWTVGDTNGAKGRSLFVRLAFQAYPRNGPAPRPTSMDIRSISSVCAPAEHRCAAPWRRPSRSSHCRRPLPPMAAPPRACSAPGSTPSDPPRPPRPPAQSTWARPRPDRAIRRVRHSRDPACRRGHRNRAITGHRYPRHSCRGGSISGQRRRLRSSPGPPLLVIARDKDVEGRHAANCLQRRCVKRGIPSIVIAPERSDFNDDLIAFGQETLAARIAPLIASTKPGGTVEERRGSGRIIRGLIYLA